MTFKPNLSVKEGLDHLAKRLDPVIAARLADDLGGHPWTVVLDILDQKKGFASSYQHWTHDLQAQLRMITERLGDFGYPFDDKNRTVSTLGNELRIVRKQLAHMHDFDVEEAFRANDFCVRLLEHFSDAGAEEARRIRREALAALSAQEGVTEQAAAASVAAGYSTAATPSAPTKVEAESDVVEPEASVLLREPTVIGDQRIRFEPWSVVLAGSIEVLDELPKKAAKERVRAVAVEIATFEGPIHVDRLVELTAQSFGLQRVRESRAKKIRYQIGQAGLFIDEHKFVWPRELDPTTWREFRPNDSTAARPFVHVSPVEIANAAELVARNDPQLPTPELEVAVLRTFGRSRRSKQVVSHLDLAMDIVSNRS